MNKELQDLAWSCLPKKIKEEVKLLYRIADSDIDRMIATIMLENVFGLHNLTSDAEGEDEMLWISRKEVQKHYQSMKNQPSIKGNYQSGYQTAIYHLFGSKCLPDEVEHLQTHSDNGNPIKYKFKVGNIVKIKTNAEEYHKGYENGYCWLPERDKFLGKIAIITDIWRDGSIVLDIASSTSWSPIDFELFHD